MRSCCCSFLPLAANIPPAPSNWNLYVHFPPLCHSIYALLTLPWTEWRGRGKETRAQPFYPLPLRLWWHNSFLLSPSALSKNPILFSQIAREGRKKKTCGVCVFKDGAKKFVCCSIASFSILPAHHRKRKSNPFVPPSFSLLFGFSPRFRA